MEVTTRSPEGTEAAAGRLVAALSPRAERAAVVGLSGELGSGKTVFVKGAAKALGVPETVTSPTFVIEKIYKLTGKPFAHLIHVDAYRLESGRELAMLGFEELTADALNLIMVEWPERVADVLPEGALMVTFELVDERTRTIRWGQ